MWKTAKLEAQISAVEMVKDCVVVSGGLAWHFMSPEHEESKTIHDHKDVDLFVIPEKWPEVVSKLKANGFTRYFTKYDTTTPGFYRYGKTEEYRPEGRSFEVLPHVKVLLDLFLERVPTIIVGGFNVVGPTHLLSLYETTHSSKDCVSVKAAKILVSRGIDPVGRPELVQPSFVNM